MKIFTKIGWIILIALVACGSLIFQSCEDRCEVTVDLMIYEPEILSWEALRAEIGADQPREIHATGKIWMYNQYLLINEPGEGIHIVENTNPANPQIKAFLSIPGNTDMAVREGLLYADAYTDMVIIDIQQPESAREVGRLKNVYQVPQAWTAHSTQSEGVVTGYRYVESTQTYVNDCKGLSGGGFGIRYRGDMVMMDASSSFAGRANSAGMSAPAPHVSIGGSMAASGLVGDFLYVLQDNEVFSFSLSNPQEPDLKGKHHIGWGIETLFPYKDKLFFGAQNGMFIYQILESGQPRYLSTFQHAQACDPVVVNDSLAFVTLRSGTACNGFVNQMDVIDIREITRPQLIKSYPFTNPHGLGLDQSLLFLCDGNAGLKVFDYTDVHDIANHQKATDASINAYDVIPWNNVAMVIAEDGLYQYSYNQQGNISRLSRLPIVRQEP